jgi:glycosyltransferase involved in cell wall biosynthesis
MNSVPKFSIVTIAYNNLEGLRRTTCTVESQLEGSYEHIIVDGGSTDGTVEWLKDLPQDTRRGWISEPDSGIYDAMNKGMRRAQGELIVMLNSGDAFSDEQALDRVWHDYDSHHWSWAYGAVRMTDSSGVSQRAYTFDPFNRARFVMGLSWIPHCSVFMERGLCQQLDSYRLDLGTTADQEFLMRALHHREPRAITWFLCDYEIGGISMTTGPRAREMDWHRMRTVSGHLWRGHPLADRLISELLAMKTPTRSALKWLGREAGAGHR